MSTAKNKLDFWDIALCLSGGGYRAAAFHLGALQLLDELGLTDNIKYLSTASGGTIVAVKFVIDRMNGRTFKDFRDDFEKYMLDYNMITKSLEVLNEPRTDGRPDKISLIRAAAGIYRDCLTDGLTVGQMRHKAITHGKFEDLIFNATEFHGGIGFRFRITGKPKVAFGNGNFEVAKSLREQIKLGDIIAASSCFPGAFEPIYFPDDFDLDAQASKHPFSNNAAKSLPLMDGGIVDNQGLRALMMSVDEAKDIPFDFVLVSDTTQKAQALYDHRAAPRRSGPRFGAVFNCILVFVTGIFLVSLILVGALVYAAIIHSPLILVAAEIPTVFSLIVSGALLAGLLYGRYKLSLLTILGTEFPIWSYIKDLTVRDLISLMTTRIKSVQSLLFSVFMKSIRTLNTGSTLAQVDKENRNLLHGRSIFSQIYDLEVDKWVQRLHKIDPDVEPTFRMDRVAKRAGKVPTSLWASEEDIEALVECGRLTTCYSLLELVHSKRQKACADQEKAANLAGKPKPPPLPHVNDPASDFYKSYKRIKAKWRTMQRAKKPDFPIV